MTSQTCLFTRNWNRIIWTFSCKQLLDCYLNLHLKFGAILSNNYKDMTLYPHIYQNVHCNLLQKKTSVYRNGLLVERDTEKILHLMIQAWNFHHIFITPQALKNDSWPLRIRPFSSWPPKTKWPTFRWGVYVVNWSYLSF